PMVGLGLGILLAVGALALTYYKLPGGVPVFVLAALTLLAGVAGLVLQYKREKVRDEREVERPRLKVYRSGDCAIEMALVQKLAKAATVLEGRLREQQQETDWAAFRTHMDEGQKHLTDDDMTEAFRAY